MQRGFRKNSTSSNDDVVFELGTKLFGFVAISKVGSNLEFLMYSTYVLGDFDPENNTNGTHEKFRFEYFNLACGVFVYQQFTFCDLGGQSRFHFTSRYRWMQERPQPSVGFTQTSQVLKRPPSWQRRNRGRF